MNKSDTYRKLFKRMDEVKAYYEKLSSFESLVLERNSKTLESLYNKFMRNYNKEFVILARMVLNLSKNKSCSFRLGYLKWFFNLLHSCIVGKALDSYLKLINFADSLI